MTQPADIADFKDQFDRDFVFGTGKETVRDTDITKAFNMADMVFNAALWTSDAEAMIAYLYASAHILVINIQDAGGLGGGAGGGVDSYGGGIIQNKSVGQVSVAYQLPTSLVENPILTQFMRTGYGQQYLQMLTPRLVGGGYVVDGWNDVTV